MADDFFSDAPEETKEEDFFAGAPAAPDQEPRGAGTRAWEGFKGGFGEEPLGMSPEHQARFPLWRPFQPLVAGVDAIMRAFPGITGAAAGAIAGFLERNPAAALQIPGLLSRTEADRLQRDLTIMGQGLLVEPGMGPSSAISEAKRTYPREQAIAREAQRTEHQPAVDAITGEPIEGVSERTAPTPVPTEPVRTPAETVADRFGEWPAPATEAAPAAAVAPSAAEPDLFTTPMRVAGPMPRVAPRIPEVPREVPRAPEVPPERAAPPERAVPERPVEEPPPREREAEPPPAEQRVFEPELGFFADAPLEEPPARVTERMPERAEPAPPEPPRAPVLPEPETPEARLARPAEPVLPEPERPAAPPVVREAAAPSEPPRVTAEPAIPTAPRQSLLQWIYQQGGISSQDPLISDVRSVLGGRVSNLIRKGGKPLDRLLQGAVNERFIDDPGYWGTGERTSTIRDLVDAMDQDARARAAKDETGRVWRQGEEVTERPMDERTAEVERYAGDIRDKLAQQGIRGEGVDTEALYQAADNVYRREIRDPLEAYDRALAEITEREYAQQPGVRGGGEEAYPGGVAGARRRIEEAAVAPRGREPGARAARKPARQEVPAEDLAFVRDLTQSEIGRPVELLDSVPLRKALAETPMPDLPDIPRRVAEFVRNRLDRLVGDTPVHFISERDLQEFAHNTNPDPRVRVNGLWVHDLNTRTGRVHELIFLNADQMWAGDRLQAAHTLLHEGTHSATHAAIDRDPRVRKAIDTLRDYLGTRLSTPDGRPIYALTDPHEFAAEVYSNSYLQDALHKVPTPSSLRASLGWVTQKGLSAWDAMVEIVRRAVGLPAAGRRALDSIMQRSPSVLETALTTVEGALRRPEREVPVAQRRAIREEARAPPAEEPGAEGRPQLVIPGAERRPAEALQRRAEAPLKPKAEQKPMDFGLFGDAAQQPDLFAPKRKAVAGDLQKIIATRLKPPGFGSKFVRWYKESFQPELISDVAMKADAAFAEYASRREGERTRIYAGGPERPAIKRERMWDKVPEAKRIGFLGQVERGEPVEPQFRAVAQLYRKMLDTAYQMEQTWGSKAQYVSDYFPHIWERPRGKPPIEQHIENLGPTWFQKARTFELIQEGLDAGYKLRNTNPEVLIRQRLMSGADMRERMRLFNEFKKMGLAREVRSVNDPAALSREGWQKVNLPNREQAFLHPDIMPGWENAVTARGYWSDETMKGDAFRAWMGFKNVWVPIKLALSGFHALHVYGINIATHLSRALHELGVDPFVSLARGKPGKAVTDLARAAESFARAFSPYQGLGKRARYQAMLGENARTPEGRWAVRAMEIGGFSPMMSEQLRIDASAKLRQAAHNWSLLKIPYHGTRLAIQKIQAPLFEHWIPHLKTAGYLEDIARWVRNNPELALDPVQERVAYRAIAKSMDNRFGEMFYSSLFWNRKIKDLGIAAHLSLGWNLGFLREFGGAGLETLTRPATAVGLMKPGEARLTARSATNKITFATVYMGTGAALMGLMTKLFTGEDPEGMDYVFPRVGGNNPDGSPRRLTTMWYLREIPMAKKHAEEHGGGVTGWTAGLRDMWFNKMLAGPVIELMRNQNYYGQQIFDPDAPAYQQMQQFFSHVAREQISPITMSGARRAEEAAGVEPKWYPTTKEGLLSYLGFSPAPKYAERTATQNRIAHLYREHVAPATRAYEEPELGEHKRTAAQKVLRALQSGDRAALATARQEAVRAGLSARYVNELGVISSDQRMFRQLSSMAPNKALAVLENASPEERGRYWPYTATKAKMMWKQRHPEETFAAGGG